MLEKTLETLEIIEKVAPGLIAISQLTQRVTPKGLKLERRQLKVVYNILPDRNWKHGT